MSDTDLIKLYSGRILALAAEMPHTVRLAAPDATVRKRAPLCGSTVTVDVVMDGDRITGFGQDVKACALGQAAASVVGQAVLGRTVDEMRKAQGQLRAMLKEEAAPPEAPFDGLEVLVPARSYTNRHASILLALDATVEAATTALTRAAGNVSA